MRMRGAEAVAYEWTANVMFTLHMLVICLPVPRDRETWFFRAALKLDERAYRTREGWR